MGAATVENGMEVHQKIKNKTTIWSINSSSEPKGIKIKTSKRYLHSHFLCSTANMWRNVETTLRPQVDEQIKEWHTKTHTD